MTRSVRQSRLAGKVILAGALLFFPRTIAQAQTVVEVQGGGSSLAGGYGATANFWRSGVDGWIGLGYLDGFRAGAFLRRAAGHGDTLGVGNSALVMRLPTEDVDQLFKTIVSWGRYAELFGYSADDQTLYLDQPA